MIDLHSESIKAGLKINIDKTKIMINNHIKNNRKIKLNNQEIKKINTLVYLGQTIERNKNMEAEINKRISQDWQQFGKLN